MKWRTHVLLGALLPALSFAADFDAARIIVCRPMHGHDCLPTLPTCKPLQPEQGRDLDVTFDMTNKTMKTPYRTKLTSMERVTKNDESLVMQGTSLQLVWSATVHRTTGRLTMAIADREGAYIVFGECKAGAAQLPKKTS